MTTALAALAALAVALACWARRLARRAPEDPLGSCRCPYCGQKLRYRPAQAGRRMLCPRCVRGFTAHSDLFFDFRRNVGRGRVL